MNSDLLVNKGMATWVVLLWMLGIGTMFGVFMVKQYSAIGSVTRIDEKSESNINAEGYTRQIIKKISNGQSPDIGNLAVPDTVGMCTGGVSNSVIRIPEDGLCLIADRIYSLKVVGCSNSDCDVWTEISTGFEVEED